MRRDKKIISLVFCSCLFFSANHLAMAARLAPGSTPSSTPLLPMPQDVYPNIQENIQRSDPGFPLGADGQEGDGSSQQPVGAESKAASAVLNKASSPRRILSFGLVALVCLAVFGLGWWYVKRKEK